VRAQAPLIGFTDRILAIFSGERDSYAEAGSRVTWVGHPARHAQRATSREGGPPATWALAVRRNIACLLLRRFPQPGDALSGATLAAAAAELQAPAPWPAGDSAGGPGGIEARWPPCCRQAGVRGEVVLRSQPADRLRAGPLCRADSALTKVRTGEFRSLALPRGAPKWSITASAAPQPGPPTCFLHFRVDHI